MLEVIYTGQENNKLQLLSPKIDVVFHALFSEENNSLTESLISDILGQKVKIKANMDRYLSIKSANEKLGIMDLRVELENGTLCNIEIQLNKHKDEVGRFTYYLTDTYSRQLGRGEAYSKLNKTISIVILDHEIDLLKDFEMLDVRWPIMANKLPTKVMKKFEGKKMTFEEWYKVLVENMRTLDNRGGINYN
ncbi:MAG: PD-(D/E)XK nuclease family transposase [Clostridia bacterium]|nr:PD-(D/E)XK nuclease family transposase [Clostridia bacterium]